MKSKIILLITITLFSLPAFAQQDRQKGLGNNFDPIAIYLPGYNIYYCITPAPGAFKTDGHELKNGISRAGEAQGDEGLFVSRNNYLALDPFCENVIDFDLDDDPLPKDAN